MIESKLKRFTKIFEKYNENYMNVMKLNIQLWPIHDYFEKEDEFISTYYYGIRPN